MSEENVEVVRRIYEAWLEGSSARELIDDYVDYVTRRTPSTEALGMDAGRGDP